jgi:DNA mismatch endonuclease (patch repair protein)
MTDIVSPEIRSRIMSGIRSKDTKPELAVRHGLHAVGLRYLLHDRRLAGRPDIVLPRYHAAIFVHGCFWHGHGCKLSRLPRTRDAFWAAKIEGNRSRDRDARAQLEEQGWRVGVVWECSLRGKDANSAEMINRLARWVRGTARKFEARG